MARPIRFLVETLPSGGVIARAVDLNMKISADNRLDLRDKLAETLKPFGCTATLLDIRGKRRSPKA